MKYFKYIALLLLVAVTASCSKEDVSYMAEPVDDSSMAYLQIGYYAPVSAAAANYIYYVDLNGVEYGNEGASFLTTFNTIPSGGVNLYYAVPAGNVNIKLHTRVSANGGYEYPVAYDYNVTLEPGKHYVALVHDFNKAPALVEIDPVPDFSPALDTDSACHFQLINLLYEEDGTPFADKIQYGIQNIDTKEYEPIGEPVAFGEVTPWMTPKVRKSVFNSSGTQREEVCIYRIDAQTGENLGMLQYTKSNGTEGAFTDYWNWYIGRAYRQVCAGIRSSKSIRCTLYQFVIQ